MPAVLLGAMLEQFALHHRQMQLLVRPELEALVVWVLPHKQVLRDLLAEQGEQPEFYISGELLATIRSPLLIVTTQLER
jgi:hypothetical protein